MIDSPQPSRRKKKLLLLHLWLSVIHKASRAKFLSRYRREKLKRSASKRANLLLQGLDNLYFNGWKLSGAQIEDPDGRTLAEFNHIMPNKESITHDLLPFSHRHRILMIATHPPSTGHAGGLRMLDIIKLLKEHNPDVYIEVFTSTMKDLYGPLDLVTVLADRVVVADNYNFSLEEYLRKSSSPAHAFDVVDFQFPQPLDVIRSYRKLGRKLIFTPMESLIRRDVIDGRVAGAKDKAGFTEDAISEQAIIETVDSTVCVSEIDRDVVLQHVQGNVIAIETGVSDIEFGTAYDDIWSPHAVCYVAYFGSNTNREALKWYLSNVHPLILDAVPDYTFSIIGRGPVDDILGNGINGVIHVGEVERLAPHIAKAAVGIAPAFSGSGFRGKTNQYAVMGVPCVASPLAADGLAYVAGESILIADDAPEFAKAIISILTQPDLRATISRAARDVTLKHYSWASKWDAIAKAYGVPDAISVVDLPSVHAIVPSYQHGPHLEERLRSIFSQEYSRLRVTVIDDHSTDASDSIIRQLNEEFPFTYIRRDANSGSPFSSWQYAADNSEEDLIWICESDDAADTMFLVKMVRLLRSRPDIKLAYCGSHIVDMNSQIVGRTDTYFSDNLHRIRWQRAFVTDGVEELKRYQRFGMTVPNMSSALIDRKAFQSAFTSEIKKYKLAGDWLFVGRLMLEGAVAYTPELLNRFRSHKETARERTDDLHRFAEYLSVRLALSRAAQCSEIEVLEAIHVDLYDLFRRPEQINPILAQLAILDPESAKDLQALLSAHRPDGKNSETLERIFAHPVMPRT
jgi:GT2 family glycosyltransferase/glycosyltransferase involved in cell wall biosynthesis